MKSADSYRRFRRVPSAALLFGICAVSADAAPNFPVPSTHVADYANVIDAATRQNLDGWLTELEQKTGAQVIALTIQSLDGEPIESFTLDLAQNKWKLGQKGKDNGVLVCVAVKDRKYRFEVGYGLEGALPDS